jgi:hypothetical protein
MHVLKVTTNHGSYDTSKVMNEGLTKVYTTISTKHTTAWYPHDTGGFIWTAWDVDGNVCP